MKFDPARSVDEGQIRQVVGGLDGVEGLMVVRFGEAEDHEFLIRFQTESEEVVGEAAPEGEREEGGALVHADLVTLIQGALTEALGSNTARRIEFVGPRVGKELRNDGLFALLVASGFILVYIWIRFTLRFSPGAIVAVVHDLLVTAGIFVILGMEFDLRILAAMLAIMGYSLNDTIIIYDRIRENMGLRTSYDLPEVLNESVNQTLSRTVLTSGTTLLALFSLFFLGGEVIRPFAFAMIIGVLVGTYSSIYIAAPVLLFLETRFGDAPAAPRGKQAKKARA